MQQMIPLKVHAYINTTVFHQDLREVATNCVTLGCCYWWQKHTLLGPGTACLAGCAALYGNSIESPNEHQICDHRAGKGGGSGRANLMPAAVASHENLPWQQHRGGHMQSHAISSTGTAVWEQQKKNTLAEALGNTATQPQWKRLELWGESSRELAGKQPLALQNPWQSAAK